MISRVSEHDGLLGIVPDGEVARLAGISVAVVQRRRARLGIRPAPGPHSKKGIDWDSQPLGHENPRAIAGRLGVTVAAVYAACYGRGINPTAWRCFA